MRTMTTHEFKSKCMAVIDEVAKSGQPVLITKDGKPIVRIEPVESTKQLKAKS